MATAIGCNSFCPLIMSAGRPRKADPKELYFFANHFYADFRGLAEGHSRQWLDKQKFNELMAGVGNMELHEPQKALLRNQVEEEARLGTWNDAQKQERLKVLNDEILMLHKIGFRFEAADAARVEKKIPGEPDVLNDLLRARTPDRIREICKDAFTVIHAEIRQGVFKDVEVLNWPLPSGNGSMFPRYLAQFADQFIDAKKSAKFPRSDRPSSQPKQLWFLSRALAGAVLGVHPRTAVNLVGSKRPEEIFEESRAGKPERKRRRSRRRRRT